MDALDRISLPSNWVPLRETDISENRIGQRLRGWEDAPDYFLYLTQQGFGILVKRTLHLPDAHIKAGIVLDILAARRQLHREAISGQGQLASQVRNINDTIHISCSSKRARPDIFDGIPYILSIFLADPISKASNQYGPQHQKALLALIEPSLVDTSDDPDMGIYLTEADRLTMMKNLQVASYPDLMRDYDLSEDTQAFMSWAGVVVLFDTTSPTTPHIRRLYRELEVRTQLAWSMSYYARKWCEVAQHGKKLSDKIAEELRYQMTPIVRRATELSDPSIATRPRRIFEGLDASSGLSAQIAAAQAGLADLESYINYLRERQRHRYNRFVEVALFLLACIQAIPILFKTPLTHTRHPVVVIAVFAALAFLIILLIVRRR